MVGENQKNEGGNEATGIAQALEARQRKMQQLQPPQLSGQSQSQIGAYRNRRYREAWQSFYKRAGLNDEDSQILSSVADFVRPSRSYGMASLGDPQPKNKFLEYLETTECPYESSVKFLLPDNLDFGDQKTKDLLGLHEARVKRVNVILKSFCSKNIYLPSPHIATAVLSDNTAALWLKSLDELENEGAYDASFAALRFQKVPEEGVLAKFDTSGFIRAAAVTTRIEDMLASRVITSFPEPPNFKAVTEISSLRKYFIHLNELESKIFEPDQARAEIDKFYSFEWVRA